MKNNTPSSAPVVLAVIGARPQFIKLAPVAKALAKENINVKIVHTGQHHDYRMSAVFFKQLGLPRVHYHLGIHGGSHGVQTGRMLEKLEEVLLLERPQKVLVFGDTNSTIAGALAAAKMHVPIAHIEAGMRSYNWEMPEEVNRLVTDHLATLHFAATFTAVENLKREGIVANVWMFGDVMADLLLSSIKSLPVSKLKKKFSLTPKKYLLMTLHRASNADSPTRLKALVNLLGQITEKVIFPIHPRTKESLQKAGLLPALQKMRHVRMIDPVGYFDMIWLVRNARAVMTDSGGVQKEAYLLSVPCITLREETEWVETVKQGWNTLTGMHPEKVLAALKKPQPKKKPKPLFGDGKASVYIARAMATWLKNPNRTQRSIHPKS